MAQPSRVAPVQPQKANASTSLLVFDTHPIQYRSPLFKILNEKLPGFQVLFFSDHFDGKKWWFREKGKIPEQNWNLDLTEGFKFESLNLQSQSLMRRFLSLGKQLEVTQPECVLIFGYYLPEHWMLWYWCRRLYIPHLFVGETYSLGENRFKTPLKKALLRIFFNSFHGIVTIGSRNRSFYQQLNIPGDKLFDAKYSIDNQFFTIDSSTARVQRKKWRSEMGIPENAWVILFVGRLFQRKRPVDLIKLHSRLQAHYENLYTVIIGNGELEAELKESSAGLPRLLLLGFQDQKATRNAYHGSDVLVVPSDYETWGLVINEAFACGLPAIVTDSCGAAQDLVLNDKTGFTYPPGQIRSLNKYVRELIENPQKAAKLGKQAQEHVMKNYSPGQFADALLRAYHAVTKQA